jgi:YesN/AraC family two-component response regulator
MNEINELYRYSKELSVLYVEDDRVISHETATFLEDFFSKVTTAYDGEEGVTLYKHHKSQTEEYYDLVITDINMPIKNGLEMIREIKAINNEQAIVVISAYDESSDLISLIDAGIANFVMKPISRKKFLNILQGVCKNIVNAKEREKLFLTQAKLASMGLMVDNLAHQWKQPLAKINSVVLSLDFDLEDQKCKSKAIEKSLLEIEHMTKYMGNTINSFQCYYKPNRIISQFSLSDVVKESLLVLNDSLSTIRIEHSSNVDITYMLKGVKHELQHVLLIVLNNAKEALLSRKIKDPKISIDVVKVDKYYKISINDNAGGVDENMIDEIFELYNSASQGRGLGLYISKNMIETHFNGSIKIENNKLGASVEILLLVK